MSKTGKAPTRPDELFWRAVRKIAEDNDPPGRIALPETSFRFEVRKAAKTIQSETSNRRGTAIAWMGREAHNREPFDFQLQLLQHFQEQAGLRITREQGSPEETILVEILEPPSQTFTDRRFGK